MRIAFAADHAGAALKAELLRRVADVRPDDEVVDLGGDGSDPNDDYPDFAQRLGNAVRDGEVDRGILICGSGVGASVAANKIRGVRAAVCHDTYSAHQGVEHDDMNVLTLGARVIGPEPALECSLAFLGATFSGESRHRRRLDKVLAIEADEHADRAEKLATSRASHPARPAPSRREPEPRDHDDDHQEHVRSPPPNLPSRVVRGPG